MDIPARGRDCEHLQCFNLETYIEMTRAMSPKRWKCPICKKKCFDLLVDCYQLQILEEIRTKALENQVNEIVFNADGGYELIMKTEKDSKGRKQCLNDMSLGSKKIKPNITDSEISQ